MRHLDLFAGIGGFSLAARWMGWQTVQFVEIDKYCQAVLRKNFPNIPIHDDIKTFDAAKLRGTVDIVTGGFPCQPFSVAGKRKGKEDDRYLWPEMLRVIGEVRPRWIVGENVAGIIGLALNQVLASLEDQGYDTETYIIPACALNAPHRRDRVWIVAYSNSESEPSRSVNDSKTIAHTSDVDSQKWIEGHKQEDNQEATTKEDYRTSRLGCNGTASNTPSKQMGSSGQSWECVGVGGDYRWRRWPTQSPICRGNDGIPNRMDRLKSLGNSIVPQIAYEIFKAIQKLP